MSKECVNKLECYFPTFFKLMWLSIVIWLLVSVSNCFGHWLLQDKLDSYGISIIFMFVVSLFVCYGRSVIKLIKEHSVLAMDLNTKKVATYALMASFTFLLLYSMWYYCGGQYDHEETWRRNGAVRSIELEVVFSIIFIVVKSAIVSVIAVLFYWYIRMCFFLFSGRIRRIGVEIALALMMLAYLAAFHNDLLWINVIVVLIAGVFLFDIWCFADFKEEQLSWDKIKETVTEED